MGLGGLGPAGGLGSRRHPNINLAKLKIGFLFQSSLSRDVVRRQGEAFKFESHHARLQLDGSSNRGATRSPLALCFTNVL